MTPLIWMEIAKKVVPVLLIGGVVYYAGRKLQIFGRTKKRILIKKTDLPTGGSGIPSMGTDSKGNPIPWNPTPMAKTLYNTMEGLVGSGWVGDALDKYVALPTDDMFTAVYISFGQLYDKEGAGSLRDWIQDERVCWNCPRAEIYNRMDRLGLT